MSPDRKAVVNGHTLRLAGDATISTACAPAARSFLWPDRTELNLKMRAGHGLLPDVNGEAGEDEELQGFREEDWISAAATITQVRVATLSPNSNIALATRAHAGLLRARCALLIINETQRHTDCEVPREFWWARGHNALEQNWEVGDFETWINKTVRLQVFGVCFHRDDVERIVGSGHVERSRPEPAAKKEAGGRPMSPLWPEWVAELASLIHEAGVPEGSGTKGAGDLISTIANRLAERGLEAPARATVQEAAKAVLLRMRAEN